MSKKKGLSFEEKRTRMTEIFFESKDVFQLKDLEKIAPKEKGITSMSVKEVLQSLVDDGMVDSERIGTSNYFWAFPSKALHTRKRKLEQLETQFADIREREKTLQQSTEKARVGRQDTTAMADDFANIVQKSTLHVQTLENRASVLKEYAALQKQRNYLKAELEKYQECDPQVIEEMREFNKVAKDAANRWTDNVFAVKSWAKKKFGFEQNRIDKTFGIPDDFDYIE